MTATDKKIEGLLSTVSGAHAQIVLIGFATLAELRSMIINAEQAFNELKQLGYKNLEDSEYYLNQLYAQWELVTHGSFTPTSLDNIEKDDELAQVVSGNIRSAVAEELLLPWVFDGLKEIGAKCYWRPEPKVRGNYLAETFMFHDDREIDLHNDGAITWEWSPEDLYAYRPDEWIAIYYGSQENLTIHHIRREALKSKVSYVENGKDLKLANFREIEKDFIAWDFTPFAFIYRRDNDPIGEDGATLRILPLTTNIQEQF